MKAPTCSVCLDCKTKELSALPCGHVFHTVCALEALEHRAWCPECKAKTQPGKSTVLYFALDDDDEAHQRTETELEKLVASLQASLRRKQQDMAAAQRAHAKQLGDEQAKLDAVRDELRTLRVQFNNMMEDTKASIASLKLKKVAAEREVSRLRFLEVKAERSDRLAHFMDIVDDAAQTDLTGAVDKLGQAGFSTQHQLSAVTRMLEWTKRELTVRLQDALAENERLRQQQVAGPPGKHEHASPKRKADGVVHKPVPKPAPEESPAWALDDLEREQRDEVVKVSAGRLKKRRREVGKAGPAASGRTERGSFVNVGPNGLGGRSVAFPA